MIFMWIGLPIHKTGSTNQPIELDDWYEDYYALSNN
jgi:hypothetical protein